MPVNEVLAGTVDFVHSVQRQAGRHLPCLQFLCEANVLLALAVYIHTQLFHLFHTKVQTLYFVFVPE